MKRPQPLQLSLKGIFLLIAIAAMGAVLFKGVGYHVERFMAVVSLIVVVSFYVIRGLGILVTENETARRTYHRLSQLLRRRDTHQE